MTRVCIPWIRIKHSIFADLSELDPNLRKARADFLLDSSRREDTIEELKFVRNGHHVNQILDYDWV